MFLSAKIMSHVASTCYYSHVVVTYVTVNQSREYRLGVVVESVSSYVNTTTSKEFSQMFDYNRLAKLFTVLLPWHVRAN